MDKVYQGKKQRKIFCRFYKGYLLLQNTKMNTITKVFEFDAAHRILYETVKCFNLHGHRFKVEATFFYPEKDYKIGYAVDFKDLKKILGTYIDSFFDHTMLANPADEDLISICRKNNWRLWIMGFGLQQDKNPSAENLAQELFTVTKVLFGDTDLQIKSIRLYETPSCWVDCNTGIEIPLEFYEKIVSWKKLLQ